MIQEYGRVSPSEMFHVFNMGLGMLLILSPDNAAKAKALQPELITVGQMVEGPSQVTIKRSEKRF